MERVELAEVRHSIDQSGHDFAFSISCGMSAFFDACAGASMPSALAASVEACKRCEPTGADLIVVGLDEAKHLEQVRDWLLQGKPQLPPSFFRASSASRSALAASLRFFRSSR